jgi:hypothetical protein
VKALIQPAYYPLYRPVVNIGVGDWVVFSEKMADSDESFIIPALFSASFPMDGAPE